MNKKKMIKEILGWIKSIAIALIVGLIINYSIVAHAVVISGSMEDTVMTNSKVIGSRLTYTFHEPERFDIILFTPPDDESSIPYLKRIIGLPNETVEIIDGKVYIDGSDLPLDDSFIREHARGSYGPFYIPEDCYFVLGDNRNGSYDSKNWKNPFVARNMIICKVYAEYFPSPQILE